MASGFQFSGWSLQQADELEHADFWMESGRAPGPAAAARRAAVTERLPIADRRSPKTGH